MVVVGDRVDEKSREAKGRKERNVVQCGTAVVTVANAA